MFAAIGQQVFVSSSKHQNSECSELSAKEASAEIRCSGEINFVNEVLFCWSCL